MPIRQKIFAIMVAVVLFLFIVDLVRRKKLRIEYSYLWMLTGFIMLTLAIWYDLLVRVTQLIGAVLPTTTLFLFAILFLIIICISFSVRLSQLSDQIRILSQELSLFKNQLELQNRPRD